MKKPIDRVWMAGSNLKGLWSAKPIIGKLQENWWWDSSGNLYVSKLGLHTPTFDSVTFASVSKKEVEIWISGWMVAMEQVAERIPR